MYKWLDPSGFFAVVLFLFFSGSLLRCQASLPTALELPDLDYYYLPDALQIQGRARLPAVSHKVVTDEINGPFMDREYLTLSERRANCQKKALTNAHSKWLSITEKRWLPQSEWLLRLKLEHHGTWQSCLDEAEVIDRFFDTPDECRLVVRYKCDPADY
ncbi:MAG: hypothetical protein KDK39_03030 [Leptospiraceae bacterium]|nr:hypothetical protein [Leptospiraceae bacterium]